MKPSLLALAISLAIAPACGKDRQEADKAVATVRSAGDTKRIDIVVTEDGFRPEDVRVPAGKPVTLVFHRETEKTCATEVVFDVEGKKVEHELPLHQAVEIAVTFPKAGKLTYACGMDMVHGTITVE